MNDKKHESYPFNSDATYEIETSAPKAMSYQLMSLAHYSKEHPGKRSYSTKSWGYRWYASPFWDKVVAIISAPVTVPLVLVYLAFHAVIFIPMLIMVGWEYVSDGLRGKGIN